MSKGPLGAGRFPVNRSPQHQKQQILETVSGGLRDGTFAPIKDRFGTELRVGDMVVARTDPDPVFQITNITPVMDPGAPPGMVRVQLQTALPITLRMGTMVPSMIRVGRVEGADSEPVADAAPVPLETLQDQGAPVVDAASADAAPTVDLPPTTSAE